VRRSRALERQHQIHPANTPCLFRTGTWQAELFRERPRFLDEQGNKFLDNHRPEKIISIEGTRFYTPLNYKGTLQRLAIRRIEFLEDGKQQVVVVPPEQFSVALRYWRTEAWLERLFCYGLYLIACGWLYAFYRKEQRKGNQT